MKTIEYIYSNKGVITHLHLGVSNNSKIGLGYVLQTYHYSIDQLTKDETRAKESFRNDKKTCLNCPLSYNMNAGKSGGCYTHKGMIYNGLISKLKKTIRLNDKGQIKPFDLATFKAFLGMAKSGYPIDLVRFGAYGEPINLGEYVALELSKLCKKSTGYTHQWNNKKYLWANQIFMSSTHNNKELKQANKKGFRSFFVKNASDTTNKSTLCPASKESVKNTTCVLCGLCNGNKSGIKNDIHINIH
jgi:hypothetical protein